MRANFREWMPVIVFAMVLLLVPLAMYLSSWIYFAIHKINPFKANFFSWLDYFQADDSDRKKQYISIVCGFFTTYLIIPLGIYSALQPRRELHGSARFANSKEISDAKLLNQKEHGIVIGKFNNRLMRFIGQQFVLLAAPTRSGKGVGIVIPNCLTWEHSLVVLDIKQENFNLTSGYRRDVLQQKVYLFNPFAEEVDDKGKPQPRTHRWNPFDNISKGVFRVGELMNLGRAFFPQTGDKEEFWNNLALNLFLAISLFLFELREERQRSGSQDLPDFPVTIGEVLRQSSGRGTGLPIKKYLASLLEEYDWLSGECRDSMSEFMSSSDDVLASILSTFNAPLGIWRNPIVDAATSDSDFDLSAVRKERMTIYIGVKPNQLPNAAKIINLMFSQLVNINTKELPIDNPQLQFSCLLLMDEFTAIGKVPIIAKAVSYIAGYNLRLLPIIQSVSQLESVYGKEDARTFITNHAMQIVYAPREQKDANEYSEMLGYFTQKSSSISKPKGLFGSGKNGLSESVSDQRRALLLPQEFKELGMWKEVVILENTKPILCEKIQYYSDEYFTDRLLPTYPINPMNMEAFIAVTQNRHRALSEIDIDRTQNRVLSNKHDQLLAMEQPYESPPDEASDDDWFNYGVDTAQANSATTNEQRTSIKKNLSDILKQTVNSKVIQHPQDSISSEQAAMEAHAIFNALSVLDADIEENSISETEPIEQETINKVFDHV